MEKRVNSLAQLEFEKNRHIKEGWEYIASPHHAWALYMLPEDHHLKLLYAGEPAQQIFLFKSPLNYINAAALINILKSEFLKGESLGKRYERLIALPKEEIEALAVFKTLS